MPPTTTTTTTTNKWTTVQTTLPSHPLPPNPTRQPITTDRLLIRPLLPTDLPALHALHRQPEVTRWTAKGRPDADEAETARTLDRFLPPRDAATYNWAVCLRAGGDFVGVGGDFVGVGGVHNFWGSRGGGGGGGEGGGEGEGGAAGGGNDDDDGAFGWPEVGYLFRREFWGLGLGTEFLGGFLRAWEGRGLRREVVDRRVKVGSFVGVGDGGFVDDGSPVLAREQLVAVVDRQNGASQRVLEKCGFDSFAVFGEKDSCDPEKVVELVVYRYFPKTTSRVPV